MESLHRFSRFCYRPALGLLLIRVATGLIFVHHGWMKFGNIEGITGFFASLGLAAFMVYVVAVVEFVGGLMLVFGVLTRAAAAALGVVAFFAAYLAVFPRAGVIGAEFELLLSAVSFGLALVGSGAYRVLHVFELDQDASVTIAIDE